MQGTQSPRVFPFSDDPCPLSPRPTTARRQSNSTNFLSVCPVLSYGSCRVPFQIASLVPREGVPAGVFRLLEEMPFQFGLLASLRMRSSLVCFANVTQASTCGMLGNSCYCLTLSSVNALESVLLIPSDSPRSISPRAIISGKPIDEEVSRLCPPKE